MHVAPPITPPGIATALALGARIDPVLGMDARHGFASARAVATRATSSFYDAARGLALIGVNDPRHFGRDGDLALLESTLHEGTHHVIRRMTGWPGLPAVARPGMLGEGLAQTIAGATLALHGPDARTRAHGWQVLDPHGQTARVGRRELPLSLTMDDLRRRGPLLNDGGGVHVHGGVVQHAHWLLARAIGLDGMLRITGETMRTELTRVTGIRRWAAGMQRAADRVYGPDTPQAQQVRAAWRAVGAA